MWLLLTIPLLSTCSLHQIVTAFTTTTTLPATPSSTTNLFSSFHSSSTYGSSPIFLISGRTRTNEDLLSRNRYWHTGPKQTITTKQSSSTKSQRSRNKKSTNTQLYDNFFGTTPDHTPSLTLAGSLWSTIKLLHISPMKLKAIVHNVQLVTEWEEIIILPFLAFVFHPLVKYLLQLKDHRSTKNKKQQKMDRSADTTAMYVDGGDNDTTNGDSDSYYDDIDLGMQQQIQQKYTKEENENTNNLLSIYKISERIGQIGKVALSVYIVDVLSVIFTTLGFTFPTKMNLSSSYAKVAYTTLLISRLLLYKKIVLCRYFKVQEDEMGQVDILNRILNGVVVTIGSLAIFDWLRIDMGRAVTGIFAFGSVGTLAFTLASRGLVTELLSGAVLLLGNKMYVGDNVIFGDGTRGKVLKIGWFETLFRGSDNIETRVPNALLSSQKISNVSRIRICQVAQTLRFRYEDADKLQQIIKDIRTEIITSCPKLIQDPSIRPFRIYWIDFKNDHLEVMIDTHHRIVPGSEEYYINRQNVLTAILRAVKKNNVELQRSSILYK